MSLISPRNLLAPLQNKVHLFTIILIAVAFLVLRLSGGSVTIHDKRQPQGVKAEIEQEEAAAARNKTEADFEKMFNPRKEAERLGLPAAPERKLPDSTSVSVTDKNYVNEMLRKGGKKKVSAQGEGEVPSEPKKGESALDEIEQSLGLR